MIWLRSTLFALCLLVTTPVFSIISLLTFPFKPVTRYRIISQWARLTMWLARVICGLHFRVIGRENILNSAAIILSKHQSAWETIAFQQIFPPQVWLLKRELLWVPFFGWGLAMTSPIAIDRAKGMQAFKQLVAQGKQRLAMGFWVVVFPEGTRMKPGERGKYNVGGAWLATHTNTPVVPVAHNAGKFWGKNAFLKYPGTVIVSIGVPIAAQDIKPAVLNQRAEDWIEAEMLRIEQMEQHGTA